MTSGRRREGMAETAADFSSAPPVRLDHIAADDTVSLYFREVGGTPLLTREEEVELAQQIEQGYLAQCTLERNGRDPEERARLQAQVQIGEAARRRLITANTRLVISLAKDYLGQGVPLLDLIQEGNLGLIRAVEKFDWRRGHKFSTYATWWVRQALTRAVAAQGRTIRLPVHIQERIRKLHHALRELAKELGREPTSEELSAALDLPPEGVERLVQYAQRVISLEKPIGDEAEVQFEEFVEAERPLIAEVAERRLLQEDLREVLGSLPSREARVLELRYGLRDGREYTLKEVGQQFGLTRERVRQLEQSALQRLRHPRRAHKLRSYLG